MISWLSWSTVQPGKNVELTIRQFNRSGRMRFGLEEDKTRINVKGSGSWTVTEDKISKLEDIW